jgi:hypothetical protein
MQKSSFWPKDDVGAWSGCPFSLRNDLKRQNVDGAPGDKFGFLRVTREKSPCLKRFDGLIIHGGCEVIVIRAALHTAIRDFSLESWIAVQSRDEFGNVLVPGVLGSILKAILDEKVFHVWNLTSCPIVSSLLALALPQGISSLQRSDISGFGA